MPRPAIWLPTILSAENHVHVKVFDTFVRMSVAAMGRLIYGFISHVLPRVIRPMHALWNQLIGFIFLLLAVSACVSAVVNLRRSNGDSEDLWRAVISFTFAAIMAYFSITSFLRARKISR
jgi:hypothetical protein